MQKAEGYKAIRLIYWFNLVYILVSYLHAVIIGEYNGDFLGTSVSLNIESLTLVLLACIVPYWGLWQLYKFYKKKKASQSVYINPKWFSYFVYFLLFWHILITAIYQVNKVGVAPYEAPMLIKFLIQISLRFNPILWAFLLVFIVPKNKYKQTAWILGSLLILGLLRGFFSIFYLVALILLIKYYREFILFVKRKWALTIIGIILFPVFVEFMYKQRDIIRGHETLGDEMEKGSLIAGKLVGRLSSFSNTAMMVDNRLNYVLLAQEFDEFFYQKSMLVAIDASYSKGNSPETRIIPNTPEGISYMLGTSGMLIFSLYRSISAFWINMISIIVMCVCVFEIIRRIQFQYNIEYAFFLVVAPMLSGVASEFSFTLLTTIILFVTLLLMRVMEKIIKNKTI